MHNNAFYDTMKANALSNKIPYICMSKRVTAESSKYESLPIKSTLFTYPLVFCILYFFYFSDVSVLSDQFSIVTIQGKKMFSWKFWTNKFQEDILSFWYSDKWLRWI